MQSPRRPEVTLLSKPEDPDAVALVAAAARLCYRPASIKKLVEGAIPREEQERLFLHVVRSGHLSCLRHANFVFGLEGVSRSFSHQLVRHNVGHSYEQQSQHYITHKAGAELPFVAINTGIPDEVRGGIAEGHYASSVQQAKERYDHLVRLGVPNYEARQVLPNGAETRLIWTANLNALLWFVQVRACRVNCAEILDVAVQVRKLLTEHIPILEPHLGPTCYTKGVCYEGTKRFAKECRKPWKPCVLWTPEFPSHTTYVSVQGWWKAGGLGQVLTIGSPRAPESYDAMLESTEGQE